MEHALGYLYFAGVLLIGLKQFEQAQAYFSKVLTYPGESTSAIAIEALKKYTLVGLLLDGKSPNKPKVGAAHR